MQLYYLHSRTTTGATVGAPFCTIAIWLSESSCTVTIKPGPLGKRPRARKSAGSGVFDLERGFADPSNIVAAMRLFFPFFKCRSIYPGALEAALIHFHKYTVVMINEFSISTGEEEYSLKQLHYWLRYEGLTGLLGGTVMWLPYGVVMSILIMMAVVFTPYMLWHLWTARWYKSIAVFPIVTGIPVLLAMISTDDISIGNYFLTVVPLVFFYLYTWSLRYVIGERLSEIEAVRSFEMQRQRAV